MQHHIQNFLNGYNITTITYGQTGAGKSHTLFGEPLAFNDYLMRDTDAIKTGESDSEEKEPIVMDDLPHHYGLIPRTVTTIFKEIQGTRSLITISAVSCSDQLQKHSIDVLGNHMVYPDPDDPTKFIGLTEEILTTEEKMNDMLAIIERLRFREASSKEAVSVLAASNVIVTLKIYKRISVEKEIVESVKGNYQSYKECIHENYFRFVELPGCENPNHPNSRKNSLNLKWFEYTINDLDEE